jgi:leucyl/phenylalanyl-tRNA--protein transferase
MTLVENCAALSSDHIAEKRGALFRENTFDFVKRWTLGTLWPLHPKRIGILPGLWTVMLQDFLARDRELPDPRTVRSNPPGLAGIVHDLSLDTLVAAYRRGLYPFGHIGPPKWWSPEERWVLPTRELRVTRRSQLRNASFRISFDSDFEGVIAGCAGRRAGQCRLTWITPRLMRAYAAAFDAGHAHSVEVSNDAGDLVGGLYGVTVGGAFVLESLFSNSPGASRLGLLSLSWHLSRWGYAFVDAKVTPTWKEMGFREISRDQYLSKLETIRDMPGRPGRWQIEADLKTIAECRDDPRQIEPGVTRLPAPLLEGAA